MNRSTKSILPHFLDHHPSHFINIYWVLALLPTRIPPPSDSPPTSPSPLLPSLSLSSFSLSLSLSVSLSLSLSISLSHHCCLHKSRTDCRRSSFRSDSQRHRGTLPLPYCTPTDKCRRDAAACLCPEGVSGTARRPSARCRHATPTGRSQSPRLVDWASESGLPGGGMGRGRDVTENWSEGQREGREGRWGRWQGERWKRGEVRQGEGKRGWKKSCWESSGKIWKGGKRRGGKP